MRVEIWMGGMTNPTYTIEAKRIDVSMDGAFARITDNEDWTFETSPRNIVIVSDPKKKGGE